MFEVMATGDMSVNQAMKLLNIPEEDRDILTKQMVSKAFRNQSLRFHPDKFDGPEEEANVLQTELGKAKEVLLKLVKRQEYSRTSKSEDDEYADENSDEFR